VLVYIDADDRVAEEFLGGSDDSADDVAAARRQAARWLTERGFG
jgi:hypothetical protein